VQTISTSLVYRFNWTGSVVAKYWSLLSFSNSKAPALSGAFLCRNDSSDIGLNPVSVAELRRVLELEVRWTDIVLPGGKKLATLRDAIVYLTTAIPESEYGMKEVRRRLTAWRKRPSMAARSHSRASASCRRSIDTKPQLRAAIASRPIGSFDGEAQ
jgi:hypothetical protein